MNYCYGALLCPFWSLTAPGQCILSLYYKEVVCFSFSVPHSLELILCLLCSKRMMLLLISASSLTKLSHPVTVDYTYRFYV